MLCHSNYDKQLDTLQDQIGRAETVTPNLVSNVIADTSQRLPLLNRARKAHINQLIESGAWIDVGLALIENELPQWKLRRLIYDDGAWHCSLSLQPNLPAGLDETAEASHDLLALAILSAFLEACQRHAAVRAVNSPIMPQARSASEYAVCCDNFA